MDLPLLLATISLSLSLSFSILHNTFVAFPGVQTRTRDTRQGVKKGKKGGNRNCPDNVLRDRVTHTRARTYVHVRTNTRNTRRDEGYDGVCNACAMPAPSVVFQRAVDLVSRMHPFVCLT